MTCTLKAHVDIQLVMHDLWHTATTWLLCIITSVLCIPNPYKLGQMNQNKFHDEIWMFINQFCMPPCPSSVSHPHCFVCRSLGILELIYLWGGRTRFLILFLVCINYSECIPLHLSLMEPGCSGGVELSPSNSYSICLSPAHTLHLATPTPPFKHTHTRSG